MKRLIAVLAVCLALGVSRMPAQASSAMPIPVPLTAEHHHHLVFSNPQIRAFYVVIPPRDQTLIHQHDVNYVWVGLGTADVVNATVNKPAVRLHSRDGMLHFSAGHFAHKAINVGATTYRNVTVELLQDQKNPRNLCQEVLERKPLHCIQPVAGRFLRAPGVTVRPDFTTDEIEFDTVTVAAGAKATLKGAAIAPVVIVLSHTSASADRDSKASVGEGARELKAGDVLSASTDTPLTLRNTGSRPARFLVFEFLHR